MSASKNAAPSFPSLFHRIKVPPYYREPFIVGGYRKPNSNFSEALAYAFVPKNNDCLNFWTHFIPLLVWIVWFWVLSHRLDPERTLLLPARLPLGRLLHVRQVCFLVDYMGISMYTFSGSLSTFFYLYPPDSLYIRYKWVTLVVFGVLCVGATAMSGLSLFYWERWRFVIRAFAYGLPYVIFSVPARIRFLDCQFAGRDCTMETHYLHLFAINMIVLLAFFFISKVPERFAPGRFDAVFQSHQLFHLCAATVSCLHMYTFPIDAVIRRELMVAADVMPDFNSTILLFAVVNACCLVLVAIMSLLVIKGTLLSHKHPPDEDVKDR
ncbi:hypothetical protein EMCRGX_G023682 [Ephydatia muelleri]